MQHSTPVFSIPNAKGWFAEAGRAYVWPWCLAHAGSRASSPGERAYQSKTQALMLLRQEVAHHRVERCGLLLIADVARVGKDHQARAGDGRGQLAARLEWDHLILLAMNDQRRHADLRKARRQVSLTQRNRRVAIPG